MRQRPRVLAALAHLRSRQPYPPIEERQERGVAPSVGVVIHGFRTVAPGSEERESSVRQMIGRVSGTISAWGRGAQSDR